MDINERIAKLWETQNYSWREVTDKINREFDSDFSLEAISSRYKRRKKRQGGNPSSANKNPLESEYILLDNEFEGDAIKELRGRFAIPENYVPRKIKTSATNGRVWFGAEWMREEVSENHLETILEQIKEHAPVYHHPQTEKNKKEKHLLIPIMYDAHIGKRVIGNQDNYVDVAQAIVNKAIARNYDIGRIMFVVGNDFGNTDNVQDNTTFGTPQDTSMHWARSIDVRCTEAVGAIEIFASLAPVDVIMVHGNHDRYSNHWLGRVLQAWFRKTTRVYVDNSSESRKYYRWGNSMWGLAHGNEEKHGMYPALMATEAKELFANTNNQEMFIGHFHQKQTAYYPLSQENGVSVRWMPALSAPDDWHKLKGFVGAEQQALALLYNEQGFDGEFPINAK